MITRGCAVSTENATLVLIEKPCSHSRLYTDALANKFADMLITLSIKDICSVVNAFDSVLKKISWKNVVKAVEEYHCIKIDNASEFMSVMYAAAFHEMGEIIHKILCGTSIPRVFYVEFAAKCSVLCLITFKCEFIRNTDGVSLSVMFSQPNLSWSSV